MEVRDERKTILYYWTHPFLSYVFGLREINQLFALSYFFIATSDLTNQITNYCERPQKAPLHHHKEPRRAQPNLPLNQQPRIPSFLPSAIAEGANRNKPTTPMLALSGQQNP